MLRNSIIEIDSKQRLLILTDSSKRLALNKKESDKIQLVGNQSSPYLWIKLKGKGSVKEQVLIDTGMAGLYNISRGHYDIFEKESVFEVLSQSKGASSIGLFGNAPAQNQYQLLLPSLGINNFELKNVITNTTSDNNSKIGAEILQYGINDH